MTDPYLFLFKPEAYPYWDDLLPAARLYALHSAFQEDNEEGIQKLVESGTKLSTALTGRKEDGSNPLHIAARHGSHKSIGWVYNQISKLDSNNQACLDFQNALDSHNKQGFTPLMLAILHRKLDSAAALLVAGANPDIPNPDCGNTALHYAADLASDAEELQSENLVLVRLLIVFFADLTATNDAGKTPLDIARSKGENAAACVNILQETIDMMQVAAKCDIPDVFKPVSIPDIDDSTFLLALDGGGVKCLATLQILLFLEKRMKQLKPECGPIKSYFDYIAGTSAGSILTLGFGYQNATPETLRASTFNLSEYVVTGNTPFSSEKMEQCLKETLGDDIKMDSVKKPRVIVTAVLGEKDPPQLHLMCNFGEPRDDLPGPSERKVWEAARASSAAPIYFEPFQETLIDGGVIANNPTLAALTEIVDQEEKEPKIRLVLSIGTGIPPTTECDQIGARIPHLGVVSIAKTILNIGDTVSGLTHLINQFISQSTQSNGLVVKAADAWCKTMDAKYRRFSPELARIYGLGEADKPTLTEIMYDSHKYALQHTKEIDEVARILLTRGPVN